MTAELMRGFEAAEWAYDNAMPPEPRDACGACEFDDCAECERFDLDIQGGTCCCGVPFSDAMGAPEWCEACGDQGVCPECVGT